MNSNVTLYLHVHVMPKSIRYFDTVGWYRTVF